MSFQYFSVVLVVVAASSCFAHMSYTDGVPNVAAQQYCGRTLATALELLCYGNSATMLKRSETGSMYNAILAKYDKESERQVDWPWMVPYKARGLSTRRGKREMIVTECCDKPCSIDELFSYC